MVPAALAAQVVTVLAPALPYLLKAGERASEEAGSRLGAQAWEQASALWTKLRPRVEEQPAVLEAAQEVAERPEDEDAQAALRVQLRKLLSKDSALAAELVQVVGSGGSAMSVSARGRGNIAVGRDISHSTIIHQATRDEMDEFVHANWLAKLVMGLGTLVALGGMGLFFFTIVSAMAQGPSLESGPDFGLAALGFGAAFVGILLYSLGRLLAAMTRG